MSSTGSATAGLKTAQGSRGGGTGGAAPTAGMGSISVKKADGGQRNNFIVADIAAADKRHTSDPAIRQASNWM